MVDGVPTFIAYCCREWIAPYGYGPGRCGICGERPEFLREDEDSWWPTHPPTITDRDER